MKTLPSLFPETEARFHAVFENAAVGMAMVALDGALLHVNRKLCSLFGYTPDEFKRLTLQNCTHPDDLATDRERLRALRAGECESYTADQRYLRKDGTTLWANLTMSSSTNLAGQPEFFVAVVQEVVARKSAEEDRLRKAEMDRLKAGSETQRRLYEALLSSTPDLAYVFDLNHRFVYANEALLKMWGRTWDEAIGRTCLELGYEPWHAAMHDREIEQVVATRQPIRGDVPFSGTEGRRIYEYIFVPVFDREAKVVAVAGTTRDVTERKRAEEKLRDAQARLDATLTAADIATWVWDIQADRMVADRNAANMFLLSDEEKQGTPVATYLRSIHPDDVERVREDILQALKTGNYECEYRLKRADGGERWVVARGFVEYDLAGKPIRFPGVLVDITDRKVAEEQNRLAAERFRQELEQLVQERTASLRAALAEMEEFSYSVSHDLRGPLRSITVFTQILMEEASSQLQSEYVNYLQRIHRSATRMDALMLDVLSLAKISRTEVAAEPIDLDQIVADIVTSDSRLQAPAAEVEVARLGTALGHPALLAQVISNLLGNAVKFVREGQKPRVRLWTEPVSGQVRLSIRDNGIGIDPSQRQRLFKMFERLRTDKHYEGTGIGLAIVAKAAARMNGTVGVDSDGANGSTFWVQLPSAEPPAMEDRPVRT